MAIFGECMICGKSLYVPFNRCDRGSLIEIKQSGKYGKTLYVHRTCYMENTLREKEIHRDKEK